ncbi:hypothetical protein [Streptomyces sp. NBC_01190]|uniref:hypothetical protein n=1 Tax=Streptomyces sp. NBC_01190 TaxID=2903767 RepID=UPI00386562D5|nr:hypothetical protein OG519_23230 [Streptomyces sp. NBC_01190]
MNTRKTRIPGTIDRPLTHDPKRRDPKNPMNPKNQAPMTPTHRELPAHPRDAHGPHQNRNLEMQLMPEALARAHMQQRLQEAEHERRSRRLLTARRLQRRAERASLRARRALAMAVMQ